MSEYPALPPASISFAQNRDATWTPAAEAAEMQNRKTQARLKSKLRAIPSLKELLSPSRKSKCSGT